MNLTAKRLRKVLDYNPETGKFVRRIARSNQRAGTETGCINTLGYVVIMVDYKLYLAHRLAWLYVYGKWPKGVDHINRNPGDNRLCNLRQCDQAQNVRNSRRSRHNTSGLKGAIYRENRGHWYATTMVRGKKLYLGSFPTAKAAHAAYMKATRQYFGEFANAGMP